MNSQFKQPDALIFDVDGTIFQTESVLDTAFTKSFQELIESGLYKGEIPPVEKMYACLGMVLDDIWANIIPDASEEAISFINERMAVLELEELEKGNGRLYPHVFQTLETIHKQGIQIYIASNGLEDYVKGVVKHCGLEHMVTKAYSAGEYQTTTKVNLVKMVVENHNLVHPWMVGDRSSDVEAGKKNGLIVVGCDYASFKNNGELEGSDIVIKYFRDILNYL